MADNVTLNAGSGGATCLTDDCSTGHAQVVKLAIATDGSATLIPADAKGIQVQQPTAADLNCTEASASAIKAAVEIIDNCIAGSEAQVDVVAALPAGTNLLGKVGIDQVTANANEVVVKSITAGDNNIGNVDVVTLPALVAGSANIGDVDVLTVPAPLSTTGAGTVATALRTTLGSDDPAVTALQLLDNSVDGNYLNVNNNIAGTDVAAGAGAVNAQTQRVIHASDDPVTTAIQIMDDWDAAASDACSVAGDTAHDAADAGEPVKIGHKNKLFDGSAPGTTVSAENDRVDSIADGYGRQYVEVTHPNYWWVSADYGAAQANASIKAAPGTNLCLFVTDIVISNGAVAGNITLLDGSGGTVLFEIYPPINGGVAISLRTPIKLTANTALCITSTTVTTHSVNIGGFVAAVTGGV